MLELQRCGPGTRVEDLGRATGRAWGLAQGGAFDAPALQRANLLVGNAPGAAGVELASGPLRLRLPCDVGLAVCGAPFEVRLDGRPQRMEWAFAARAGQLLSIDGPLQGQRALLALQGGVLGGARELHAGDPLVLGAAAPGLKPRGLHAPVWTPLLRALPAPEYALLTAEQRALLWRQTWTVSPHSDRMGLRLQGDALRLAVGSLLSHGVQPGLLQLPPSGQPILLGVDAQATGGYPRLLCVIAADLWKLAQARPGAALQFQRCTPAAARAALAQQRQALKTLAQWLA